MKTGTLEPTKPAPTRPRDEAGGWLAKPAGWWDQARTFVTEVQNELKRVTWPARREVYATTTVVLLVSIFFGAYLWLVDLGLASAVHALMRQFGAA